ncbi:MAG TPA: ABC transporter ATP-binding protein [bacterium]|nr:ABC transporter ATP-binding protein [bacterium]
MPNFATELRGGTSSVRPRMVRQAAPGLTPAVRASEALVVAREVRRTYHQGAAAVIALASATCTVMSGDRIAVVGPSGSGKSTLLHLMGGLESPTSGEISWPALGARATLRPARVALVFQMPSLLPALTALENVELPLLLRQDVTPGFARDAARDALERIGLTDVANKLPEELSGGQAQRVAIARALGSRPALILADEPTGQLDHLTAGHVLDAIEASLADTPVALVMATHDPAVAARMDTVWRIRHGVLKVTE